MIDQLLALVAPHSCCGCGNAGSIMCLSCKNDIVYEPFSACLSCLRPTLDTNLCSDCSKQMGVGAGWCVGVREGAIKRLLDRYKFDSAKEAGGVCADILDQRLPILPSDTVIAPVPTSLVHQRVRGFDHTLNIAKRLAVQRSLACSQLLTRYGSDTQHFKTRTERIEQADRDLGLATSIVPPSILLIDDIYTTGATVRASVRKLREAGAKKIFVAIIARQTLDEMSDLW